jgi:hypothetical protein
LKPDTTFFVDKYSSSRRLFMLSGGVIGAFVTGAIASAFITRHFDFAGAVGGAGEVVVGGGDVGECAAVTADHGGHGGDEASCGASGAEQVDGQGEVAEVGESVGVGAHGLVEAEDFVDHHHGGPGTGARWAGQVAAKGLGAVAGGGEVGQVDVGHGWAFCGGGVGNV